MKTLASQAHTTANKWDDNRSIASGGADGDRSRSNKKLFKSKKSTIPGNNRATKELKFLTSSVRKALNLLRQAFIKAPILQHFDLEYYIQIKTNVSGYAIRSILSQLTFNQLILKANQILINSDFGQWH